MVRLEPFFKTLLSRKVNTVAELEIYITHYSELISVFYEDYMVLYQYVMPY